MMMMVMVVGVWCVVCSGTWGFSGGAWEWYVL